MHHLTIPPAIGPALSIALGPDGATATVTDRDGPSWPVRTAGTSSVPLLVEAVGEVDRVLRR